MRRHAPSVRTDPFENLEESSALSGHIRCHRALQWLNHFESSLKRLTCVAMCPATLNLVLDLRLCGGSSDPQIKPTSNTLQTCSMLRDIVYIISTLHLLDYGIVRGLLYNLWKSRMSPSRSYLMSIPKIRISSLR